MFKALRQHIFARKEWKRFTALSREARRLVFYSEGPGYWPHFEPIISELWRRYQQPCCYLSSDINDPVLRTPPEGVMTFFIGDGTARTLAFPTMEASVVVMTMPDLQTYYIKRSPYVEHYVYIHHSMVSTHMIYRPEAFDHFDVIFCTGPHHIDEIRTRERLLGLPRKKLIEHGYARLEALIEELGSIESRPEVFGTDRPNVLIAPSWGENALLERLGIDFIDPLLKAGLKVTLRPHPQTKRFKPKLLDSILASYGSQSGFTLEVDIADKRSLLEADLMISDWSGAALEFAFARLKPVLFVDVPRKVNNPDYQALEVEPLEARIREHLGAVVPEQEALTDLTPAIERILADGDDWHGRILKAREANVFNLGHSAEHAADALMGFCTKSANSANNTIEYSI